MRLWGYVFTGMLLVLFWGCGEKKRQEEFHYFRNYQRTFNDLNDKHLNAAHRLGIQPLVSDDDWKGQGKKLVGIKSCRNYELDKLTHSIPYLVPKAEELLSTIGRNFRDSLSAKGLPDRKIIVTSALRTTGNVKTLRKKNINASANSAHVYGTTFDITYARYKGAKQDERDKLKSVLAEVLQDLRKRQQCYVRYEVKQLCFHVTVR